MENLYFKKLNQKEIWHARKPDFFLAQIIKLNKAAYVYALNNRINRQEPIMNMILFFFSCLLAYFMLESGQLL